MITRFIWKGGKKGTGFHLTKWKNLAKPKQFGGWGIKHLPWFAQSLAAKSCWRGLFETSLWNTILRKKYLKGIDIVSWLRNDVHTMQSSSIIWQNLMHSLPIIKRWLAWEIGTGQCIVLGRDPFIGCNDFYQISTPLLQFLNSHHIFTLAQATAVDSSGSCQRSGRTPFSWA
jgi:hypothetical protein